MKISIFLILLFIAGCQSTEVREQGYTVNTDKFKQTSRYSIVPGGELDGAPMFSLSQVFVDIFADANENNIGTTLAVILHFENWAMINPGESLIMIVDGERIIFTSPSGSAANRGILKGLAGSVGGVRVREEAHYAITTDQIKKLAYSSSAEIRLYGSKQTVERSFDEEHILSIRDFYEKFILKNQIKSI